MDLIETSIQGWYTSVPKTGDRVQQSRASSKVIRNTNKKSTGIPKPLTKSNVSVHNQKNKPSVKKQHKDYAYDSERMLVSVDRTVPNSSSSQRTEYGVARSIRRSKEPKKVPKLQELAMKKIGSIPPEKVGKMKNEEIGIRARQTLQRYQGLGNY